MLGRPEFLQLARILLASNNIKVVSNVLFYFVIFYFIYLFYFIINFYYNYFISSYSINSNYTTDC